MREREDDIASVSFDSMSHTHTHFLSVITVGTSLVILAYDHILLEGRSSIYRRHVGLSRVDRLIKGRSYCRQPALQ